ncbi:MAG: ATP-binding protein [Isosphaeraceae bacterium]
MELVPFQTRARTIDHLGRGQIADCPTAISELWKNAYDAYARRVALHIFDGKMPVAALVDDGHGMSRTEFADRWLVVGTESKVSNNVVSEGDRNGLPPRERQGEKGIGRLSVAYLGPTVLVLSKRRNQPFVASLVDWRLFENPHLGLGDVRVPVEEFGDPDQFRPILSDMFNLLLGNIRGSGKEADRDERVRDAWSRYSQAEAERSGGETTAQAVESLVAQCEVLGEGLFSRYIREWPVWDSGSEHGTALFVFNIHHELGVWVDPGVVKGDTESETIKKSLRDTLTGFTDPYADYPILFDYGVLVHTGSSTRVVVSTEQRFGFDDLMSLEHVVIGDVDELGVFRGRVKAWGHDMGEISLPPQRPPSLRSNSKVGPFSICIATFEQMAERSSHPPEVHQRLSELSDDYSGLAIYRDGLRVMPYGRPDADYFGIEERRSLHAGRAFWSHRRSFGRVAITRTDNPNLKDKAGREGLIDNRAKREMRILVVDLLKQTASRYFNLESPTYRELLPGIIEANRAAKEAEDKLSQRRSNIFRQTIRKQSEPLAKALEEANATRLQLREIVESESGADLARFEERLNEIRAGKAQFRPPPRPAKLGKFELPYREYRDRYAEYCTIADEVAKNWAEAIEKVHRKPPDEEAKSELGRHQAFLHQVLRRFENRINERLTAERARTGRALEEDRKMFYVIAAPLLKELEDGRMTLALVLRQMEEMRDRLQIEFDQRYGSYTGALEQLAEGIDLEALVNWSGEQREQLQSQVEQLNALAQLGITVEIVGHELESIDADIAGNLGKLPPDVKHTQAFRDITAAHNALVDRLRFLAPMKLSGTRLREDITGERIYQYVKDFFGRRFESFGVDFAASDSFRSTKFRDYAYRVMPVFINLVNNSIYWVHSSDVRKIRFDTIGDEVVVADSGPGIDPDDLRFLFRLFFSRRVEGRGVGLYLCRANLAAGGHTIEYATEPAHRILDGANFVIRFQGLSHA